MKHKSQSGFALIEGLLSVIAISLVIFVGFYVYNSQQKTSDTLNKANASTKQAAASSTEQVKYLVVKELGVKIPLKPGLKDLKYEVAPDQSTVGFTTEKISQAVSECKSSGTASSSFPAIGIVTKISGKYDPDSPPQDVFSSFSAQFQDFYLTYGAPDGGPSLYCNGDSQAKTDNVTTLANQITPALKEAIKNAKQI